MNRYYQDFQGQTIWFFSELYYPEESSTGHLITKICEGLARGDGARIRVLCAQPTYSKRGISAPSNETVNGVTIKRIWSTTFSKDRLVARAVNILTISMSFLVSSLLHVKKGERIVVVTNPPLLPFVAVLTSWLKGASVTLLVHDVYPEVLTQTGLIVKTSFIYKALSWCVREVYRSVQKIIVLGRDMQEIVQSKDPSLSSKTVVIPNWCDEMIRADSDGESRMRTRLALENYFVVQYSGNIGRTHGIQTIIDAAELLERSGQSRTKWVICGWGGQRRSSELLCQKKGLRSVVFLDPFPRTELNDFLNCCDVSIISFIPGMAGISVPSRMYNVLASGKPILAVSEANSELSQMIAESDCGWRIEPNSSSDLADLVSTLSRSPEAVKKKSLNCSALAKDLYSFESALAKYKQVILS